MQAKNITYNIDGNECMLVQATPTSRTMDIFINGKYSGIIAVKEIIDLYL